MKRKRMTYCLIIAIILINFSLFAIGDPPGPEKPPPPHPELPIDGGIPYLFITGIAYGVYQITRKNS